MTDPWWKGRCAEIAESVNVLVPEMAEVTAFQVEQVLIAADDVRHRPKVSEDMIYGLDGTLEHGIARPR